MSARSMPRLDRVGRMAAVAAPLTVLAGTVIRPYVSTFTDDVVVGRRATGASGRWVGGSLVLTAGIALAALAVTSVAGSGRRGAGVGQGRLAVPAALAGSACLAFQYGSSGLGTIAANRAGAAPGDYISEARAWEVPALIVGVVAMGVAWISTARSASVSESMTVGRARVMTGGAVIAALSPINPSSLGDYGLALGLAALLVPIASAP
jgi:hypothetical protein